MLLGGSGRLSRLAGGISRATIQGIAVIDLLTKSL